ncbi:MAG: DUF3298 domain-containing protein [Verrucomicrobiales bacterium]
MKYLATVLISVALCVEAAHAQIVAEPVQFARRYEGVIGTDLAVTLLLAENRHECHRNYFTSSISGVYFYHRVGMPIDLTIEPQNDGRSVFREEAVDKDGNRIITGIWNVTQEEGRLWGTWQTGDGKKSLPVALDEKYPEGSVEVRMTTLAASYTLWRNNQRVKYERSLSYPQTAGTGALVASINAAIRSFAGSASAAELEKSVLGLPDAAAMEFDPDYEFDDAIDEELGVLMNSDGFLTIEARRRDYSGGAHGEYSYSYAVIDLSTGNTLRLPDLANANFTDKWAELGAAALRKQAGLPPNSPLREAYLEVDKLELSDTWFLVPGGIGFSYDPYEIGSFARGQVVFILEWKNILGDLKPGTRVHALASRMAAKGRKP